MSGEPIMVPCEGSGQQGHNFGNLPGTRMCMMCGGDFRAVDGIVVEHDRDDLLARIVRGDFDS